MSDQVMLKTKEELAEEARLAKLLGTSEIDFVPTDDNILLIGTAKNSCLGLKEDKYDKDKYFTFKIIGFGKQVTDMILGDTIRIMNGSETGIVIDSNLKSFKNMTKMLKGLSNKDYTELIEGLLKDTGHADMEFSEYFVIKRYNVLGVYTNDKSRNALSYDGQENVSNS